MADYSNILSTNEEIVRVAHRHIIFMILNTVLWLVGSIVLIGAAGLIYAKSPWQETNLAGLVVILSFIPLGITIYRFLVWRTERYVLTTFRIIQLEGIFNRRLFDSALEMINDVEMRQSVFGRVFNYGSIHILTAADAAINDLDGINDPYDFKRLMVDTKMELSSRNLLDTSRSQGVKSTEQPQIHETNARLIVALTELRNAGTISDDEFDEKMKKITGN